MFSKTVLKLLIVFFGGGMVLGQEVGGKSKYNVRVRRKSTLKRGM